MLIRCRFEQNRTFFRDYLCEESPRISVQPSEDDLERIRVDFKRTYEAEFGPNIRKSDASVENLALHSLIAEQIVSENVLLMHGSALCMDGKAVVFTAKSGTGKSTHTRLWREVFKDRVVMINDDKPFLKIEENGVTVYGTPWDGKHHLSRNISAPLKAIVRLERDTFNRIEPMSRADAFPVLAERSYSSKDPAAALKIISLQKKLLDAADYYVLRCNRDPDAARVAEEGIFGPQPDSSEI